MRWVKIGQYSEREGENMEGDNKKYDSYENVKNSSGKSGVKDSVKLFIRYQHRK